MQWSHKKFRKKKGDDADKYETDAHYSENLSLEAVKSFEVSAGLDHYILNVEMLLRC